MVGRGRSFVTLGFVDALAWPTFALVALLLALRFLSRRFPTLESSSQEPPPRVPAPRDQQKIAQSLDDAEWLASIEAEPPPDPVVHLTQAVHVAPSTFRESAQQVRESFRIGRVVILDIAATEESTAVRLVDFCGAMVLASRGTLHRLSSTVLLLTPRIA
ncbi:cell division protein SepF [Amycolatopsis sp. CA-230715]|uniref:cell division protein SepF n=1 Tax=Amycolatopsis sp. CA-230715 TaxID=2745196 RepID=UPI003FA41180